MLGPPMFIDRRRQQTRGLLPLAMSKASRISLYPHPPLLSVFSILYPVYTFPRSLSPTLYPRVFTRTLNVSASNHD